MRKSVPSILLATACATTALTASLYAAEPTVQRATNGTTGAQPALDILRQINHNPALINSTNARNDALLTTGSVVKSGGRDRVLYHLPATELGLRLSGETTNMEWPVHVAREQLTNDVSLRIAYQNAVSVMPEASHLAVEVNGVMIGKHAIQSPERSRTLNFPVPTNILVPGYNSVRLIARQRHRVDCSIGATHELWTDIDPTQSGFVFETGNSALRSLDSIAALARNKAGQVKMRLLTSAKRDAGQVGRLMLLAQHTAIHADFTNPLVEVAADKGKGPGLDIFTGSLAELKEVAPEYASAIRNDGTLQVLSRDGDERVALILVTSELTNDPNHDKFAKSLIGHFPKRAQRGSRQGIAAAHRLSKLQVSEGKKIPFSELGLQSEEFDGRLYRRSFQINLPSDYFSADYNQAEMHLATGYSAGLDHTNKFIIRVNGATATGFALSKSQGHVFHDKMLRLPLSSFKPGVNHIELEAQLAGKMDRNCEPAQQISGPKRFVMSGKSWIKFPRLAHLARLPDLAGTVSAGFPYVIAGKAKPSVISVPTPGFTELSAAAGFATRIAVNSGVPLDFELKYSAPSPDVKNAIVVGTFDGLPRDIANGIKGIDQGAFQTAWQAKSNVLRNRQMAVLNMQNNDGFGIDMTSTASISKGKQPTASFTANQRQVGLEAFDTSQKQTDPLDNWTGGAPEERDVKPDDSVSFGNHISSLFKSVLGFGAKKEVETPVITNPNSDVLLTQRISPSDEYGVWTVVTAPSEQALKSGMVLMSRPEIASRISGETATVNGIDRTVTASVTSQSYVQVRGFSPRNAHLVVAGWFSNNHHIYSLLLLAGLLGFGFISTRLLGTVGVNRRDVEDTNNA